MPATQAADPRSQEPADPLIWLLAAIISGLTFVRWWMPTEGMIQGDTLGIVLGWFIALALLGWIGLRGTTWLLKLDGLQWAVWLLAGGHVLSGCLVVASSGDRRAALNLSWEWLGLAIAAPLLRLVLANSRARREWTVVALGAVITLSTYGFIQRNYIFPQTVAQYQKVRQELDEVEHQALGNNGEGLNYRTQTRIQKLQNQLIEQGVQPHMLAGSSRSLFEARLLHSTEILGRFALANTFAGLLLVWWIILTAQTLGKLRAGVSPVPGTSETGTSKADTADRARPRMHLAKIAFLVACSLLIGYCLLLTKSRTAYIATIAGLAVWSVLAGLGARPTALRVTFWSFLTLAVLVLLVTIAGLTGGLDGMVLAEAPKSLQYRLEYWWSSLQVIKESPLFGVGPGQFRQHYLVHKLPQSSEEIADPHNLILDVWANGGILALVGLCWLIFELVRGPFKTASSVPIVRDKPEIAGGSPVASAINSSGVIAIAPTVRDSSRTAPISRKAPATAEKKPSLKIPRIASRERTGIGNPGVSSGLVLRWTNPIRLGSLCSLIAVWLTGGGGDTSLWLFLGGWAIGIGLIDGCLPTSAPTRICWMAAGVGLCVHLLGAGGIAMPALTQLLVLLAILGQSTDLEAEPDAVSTADMAGSTEREPVTGQTLTQIASPDTARRVEVAGVASSLTAMVGLGLFGACFVTAARPVWLCMAEIDQADFANSLQKREQLWRRAAADDPLATEPWEKLAAGAFSRWKASNTPDNRDFELALTAQRAAIERNPLGHIGYRTLGEFLAERARHSGSVEDKQAAVVAMQTALLRYPHHAELAAVAAEIFSVAGEAELAEQAARDALIQDDINHVAGHSDKWLVAPTRQRIEKLTRGSTERGN